MRQPDPPFQKAIELLGRRSHFRREIEAKLAQRGYSEKVVATTLERLADQELIDDRETAREFVRTRMARKPMGRLRLLSDLRSRGVEGDVAGEALDALYPEDDLDLARQASQRFRGGSEALARRLSRMGFTSQAIVAVLRDREVAVLREREGEDGDEA